MENFGKFMTIILVMFISAIVSGFVILKLWAWFIVPIFEIQPLKLVEATGLMLFIVYLKINSNKKVDINNFWKEFKYNLLFLMVDSVITLFVGWIITLFM